jgi:diacylglycerol O-acyltransferase
LKAKAKDQSLERLSRADTARWHMGTPQNPMVIGALLLFEQRLTLEALEALVRDRLMPHRRFRQHVVESGRRRGRPCWRDDAAFDLREHVRQLDSPSPADDAALAELASERLNAPLPPDRSPWSFELLELAPTGSALVVRIHHSIADGRALVSVLGELADEDLGAGQPGQPGSPGSPPSSSRRGHQLLGQLAGLFRFPLRGDPVGLLRRPLEGRKRAVWSEAIPLDSVKSIARASGHHVADVLLAAVAGALDRYQRAHGQAPRSVRALLPVALPPDVSEAASDQLGNHYASVFVRLPIAVADPHARLEAVARQMAALRSGGPSRIASNLTSLLGAIAPSVERWAVRWGTRRASLVVSSLAGPSVALHIAGQPLHAIVIWAPAPASVGLSVTCFGYAGALRAGVLADTAVIARPEELVTAFQAALDELGRVTLPNSR